MISSFHLALESIEEEYSISLSDDEDEESLFSLDFNFDQHNVYNYKEEEERNRIREVYKYYVAVGQKSESSMDALLWTLNHAVNQDDQLVVVHVFPHVRFIPSPLGMLPKSTVRAKMVDKFMAQERDRRMKFLEKYVDACSKSNSKLKVDIVLIESDTIAKAILDHILPTQIMKTLVVGTTKTSMRKLRSKKGSGIASQILRNAPETCDVKIICKGKEVIDQMAPGSPSSRSSNANSLSTQEEDQELPI